jgi:hypothetical protein
MRKVLLLVTVFTENLALLDQKCIFRLNLKANSVALINHAVSFIFKKEDKVWMIIHGQESWKGI